MRKKQKEGAIDNSAPVAPFTTTTVALKYSAFPRQRVAALVGLISGLNPAAGRRGGNSRRKFTPPPWFLITHRRRAITFGHALNRGRLGEIVRKNLFRAAGRASRVSFRLSWRRDNRRLCNNNHYTAAP